MSNPVGAQRYGLGGGDAYYDAVKYGGYTGTREQFGRDQAEFAQNATAVAEAREEVEQNTQTVVNTAQTFTEETVPAAIQSVEEKGDTEEDRLEARTTELVEAVNTAGAVQVQAVRDEGTTQIGLVSGAGTAQVEAVAQAGSDQVDAVEAAGSTQVGNVNNAGTTQVGNVNSAGTTQVGNVNTAGATQVQAVEDKGEEVLNSIPADYTDLIEEVDNLNSAIGEVDYTSSYGDGYFNGSGGISAQSSTYLEIYTETYIPVICGETLTVTIALSESKAQWARWVFYDADKNYVSYGTQPQTSTQTLTITVTVPENVSYMRISFRSFGILTSLSINRNKSIVEALNAYTNSCKSQIIRRNPNCIFVAHQGYDPNSTGTDSGYNKIEGFYLAAEHGFDAGECDLRFTADDIPVGCHSASFVDATSGVTVTIENETYADLITHDYYGGKIASLENILLACKKSGLILFIDQLAGYTSSQWDTVFNLVKKTAMSDRVVWLLSYTRTAFYSAVISEFPNASFEFLADSGSISSTITYANSIASNDNVIYIGVNYAVISYSDVATYAQQIDSRIKMAAWTIPEWIPTCINYMQYCGAITSNRTCYNDVWEYGIG